MVSGSGGPPAVDTDPASLRATVASLEEGGTSRKDAIKAVATRAGVPKRVVYDAVHEVGE